jgi:GNAT superfamily N-acetyltransferase
LTEIRPILDREAEEFLELLCSVFHLDYARARGVFFTEPFFDLQRKWALFEGKEMISILTTTPLQFGWGKAYGIAGVATKLDRRGEGHASKLLERVHRESARWGETGALLFAKDVSLYGRNGFESIDAAVRGRVVGDLAPESPPQAAPLENDSIEEIYNRWAEEHPDRLRRDRRRWNYWHWNYRICGPFDGGYLCEEPSLLREAIFGSSHPSLPVHAMTEWYGTTFMADLLNIPFIGKPQIDFFLMGRNIPSIPQMFMTDQF